MVNFINNGNISLYQYYANLVRQKKLKKIYNLEKVYYCKRY